MGPLKPTKTCSTPYRGCADDPNFIAEIEEGRNKKSMGCEEIGRLNGEACWLYQSVRDYCKATCHTVFCDTERSPCGPITGANGQKCEDNDSISFGGKHCPEFCDDPRGKAYMRKNVNHACHY